MTDPNPLKQAAEEAKARKLAEVAQRQRETTPVSPSAELFELQKNPFRMRISYDPGNSFDNMISEARVNFVDFPISVLSFERPCGGSVTLNILSHTAIRAPRFQILELLDERGERFITQEELLGIAAALRGVQGSFLIASGIFYGQPNGTGKYDENFLMVLVIDGDDRSIVKMSWDDFISRPGHTLAVVKNTVPRPSDLRARSGSMP
jgi:hypothetical protein